MAFFKQIKNLTLSKATSPKYIQYQMRVSLCETSMTALAYNVRRAITLVGVQGLIAAAKA